MLWPMDAKAVVCLTGDIDAAQDVAKNRLDRIFEVLDDHKIKYTFFITAQLFLDNFDAVKPVVYHGDEIAGHGDVHTGFSGQEYVVQKKRLENMISIIRDVSGIRVKGFRAPNLSGDLVTTKAANDVGLIYDSTTTTHETWINFRGNLLKLKSRKIKKFLISSRMSGRSRTLLKKLHYSQPLVRVLHISSLRPEATQATYLPFNPLIDGKTIDILVIPVSNVDDRSLIDVGPKYRDWEKVAKIWQKTFDDIYMARGVYVLLAHPLRIGTRQFIGALRSLIEHATEKGEVWFATLAQLAEWWKTNVTSSKSL